MKKLLLIFLLFFISLSYGQIKRASNGGGSDFDVSTIMLAASDTVNLDNGMTVDSMNTLILAIPQNLGGYQLTIQFADGSYTFGARIEVKNFYNGTVRCQGNPSETTASKTKSVNIDFSHTGFGFYFTNVKARTLFFSMKVSNTSGQAVLFERCEDVYVSFVYIVGDNNTTCTGVQFSSTPISKVQVSTFGLALYAVYATSGGQCYLKDNDDGLIADIPQFGQVCEGVTSMRISGTVITGTNSDNAVIDGGTIR